MLNPAFMRAQNIGTRYGENSDVVLLDTPLFDGHSMRKSVLNTKETDDVSTIVSLVNLDKPISLDEARRHRTLATGKLKLSRLCMESLVDVLITAWQFPRREGLIACDFVSFSKVEIWWRNLPNVKQRSPE